MSTIGEKISFLAIIFTMMSISSSPHPFILVACYVLHEFGHITFAKCVGANIEGMKKGILRLAISYDCSSISYFKELLVCAGGIIFNFIFALCAFVLGFGQTESGQFFILCNISLALMNFCPVTILDGGGIVRSFTLMICEQNTAEKICKTVSFIFAFILWFISVYLQLVFSANISFFLISVLLLIELCFSA
jgi:Zn-dependent protease